MAVVVRMPSVAAGAEEATVANWLVSPGDMVTAGTPLAEIETEKALVEYAAEDSGVVGRLVAAAGETVEIGSPIAVLLANGETEADIDAALGVSAPAAPAAPAPVPASESVPRVSRTHHAIPSDASAGARHASAKNAPAEARSASALPPNLSAVLPPCTTPGTAAGDNGGAQGRIFASPLVRKIAGEKGIDLATITGTGPNGRIVRRDLERFARAPEPRVVGEQVLRGVPGSAYPGDDPRTPGAGTLIPHTPMRRAIARRLTESKATVPHFYMAAECVVDDLLSLRAQINESSAVKISVNDFVVMAAAAAYRDVPEANVTWREDGLLAHRDVDIAIAVATDGGLVTPVLRDVGSKKLSDIARLAADVAKRARDRRLRQDELEGGVLSVSNLGMFGTVEFSAIINPPQSGILAVGAAKEQPVVRDGALAVATVLRCTLSVDHRAVDGALAARWLAAFTNRIEHPLGMIA